MKFPFQVLPAADFDVLGFGTNAIDHLIRVPKYPAFDSKIELTSYTRDAGGEAATTMVGLQRLGLKTAYAGRFGDDAEGVFGRQSLIHGGVDISYTEQISGAATQIGFIIVDETSGRAHGHLAS
jgi:sugar/nucleoside kinase (ribokinase family)